MTYRAVVVAATLITLGAWHEDARCDDDNSVIPDALQKWLQPQEWQRDTDGPIVSLGKPGDFDDTHLFAPCVAQFDNMFHLWYSGSQGTVTERVFDLGLATSQDGRQFTKHASNPVFRFGDGKHSILTATLLRRSDGTVLRKDGALRMWFSSTHFSDGTGHHALYETQSTDGVTWSQPSRSLLDHVYAPTILKEGDEYRMWYTDVSGTAWVFRSASSGDGRQWRIHPDPVLKVQAAWERSRLFYPTVLKADGVYLMWYGSYWSRRPNTTAIGMAASLDGFHWYRHPQNPVLRPDPARPWESHYTTSQSVIRDADGSFRIWYASRKKPPFVNKYFAINTATWDGPDAADRATRKVDVPPTDGQATVNPMPNPGHGENVRVDTTVPLANGTMTVIKRANAKPDDLLIHFHGATDQVAQALVRTDLNVVLVFVSFPGLSTAYSKPFQADPKLFPQIQDHARSATGRGSTHPWRKIYLSSFSAGYGAVREILKNQIFFDQIDGVVAADSIYAGLQKESAQRSVNETNMRDFLRFAALARDGHKTFALSHSAQPTPYASTTETADYLLKSLNIDRLPERVRSSDSMLQLSRGARGKFLVLGFDGTSGKDHLQHLHHIDLLWKSLERDD